MFAFIFIGTYSFLMKKFAILFLMVISAFSLYAHHEYYAASATYGHSSVCDATTLGFGTTYQLLASLDQDLALGIGTKADIDLLIMKNRIATNLGLLFGPALEIALSPYSALNLSAGLSFYEESLSTKKHTYVGIGAGFDISYNYYSNGNRDLGLCVGITGFNSFVNYANTNFGKSIDWSVYFGLSTNVPFGRKEHIDYFYY